MGNACWGGNGEEDGETRKGGGLHSGFVFARDGRTGGAAGVPVELVGLDRIRRPSRLAIFYGSIDQENLDLEVNDLTGHELKYCKLQACFNQTHKFHMDSAQFCDKRFKFVQYLIFKKKEQRSNQEY